MQGSALPAPHTHQDPPFCRTRSTQFQHTGSLLWVHPAHHKSQNTTCRLQGHLQVLPLWIKTRAKERGGAPVEFAQMGSGAGGASQLPSGQVLLMATRAPSSVNLSQALHCLPSPPTGTQQPKSTMLIIQEWALNSSNQLIIQ